MKKARALVFAELVMDIESALEEGVYVFKLIELHTAYESRFKTLNFDSSINRTRLKKELLDYFKGHGIQEQSDVMEYRSNQMSWNTGAIRCHGIQEQSDAMEYRSNQMPWNTGAIRCHGIQEQSDAMECRSNQMPWNTGAISDVMNTGAIRCHWELKEQ